MTLDAYLPVILFILVGVFIGVVPQVLGFLAGPHRPDQAKNSRPTNAASRPSKTRA